MAVSKVAQIAEALKRKQAVQELDYPELLEQTQTAMTSRLWELEQGNLSPAGQREKFMAFILKELESRGYASAALQLNELALRLYNDTQRYSILTQYLEDPLVEGIHINSWRDIRICHTDGRSEKVPGFNNPSHASDIVRRLLQESKVTMDSAVPVAEASIGSNIRVTAVMSPIVDEAVGVAAYIRLLRQQVFTEEEYIRQEFASRPMLRLLQLAARRGVSSLYVGKVNTGKTSLVKHVLSTLPDDIQVDTIETGAREMDLVKTDEQGTVCNNIVHMLARPHEIEEQNITQEKLVVICLRMNPDVCSVAEARDVEAYNAVETSLSGHTVITTTHAGSPRQGHHRVATLARKRFGSDLQTSLQEACQAFPLVVFIHMTDDHVRRIMNISECWVDEAGQIHYSTLWEFRVRENRSTPSGIQVIGEYISVNAPSDYLVARMRLYGITDEELQSLNNLQMEGKEDTV